jgi:hypothetical protein
LIDSIKSGTKEVSAEQGTTERLSYMGLFSHSVLPRRIISLEEIDRVVKKTKKTCSKQHGCGEWSDESLSVFPCIIAMPSPLSRFEQ